MRSVGLLIILSFAGYSQETLTVELAVTQALQSHPLLSAAESRVLALGGQRRQAGLHPNPRFNFQIENLRAWQTPGFQFSDGTDTFAFLQQTIETGGRRSKRVDVAASALGRAERERELVRFQVAARVRGAYWAASGAQQLYNLLSENYRNFLQVVEYHEIRVREGAMAEADLLRIRLEAERYSLAANNAALDARRNMIALYREMGRTEFPDARLVDPLEGTQDTALLAEPEKAIASRPELGLARANLAVARSSVTLQQALARPTFDVLGGYKRSGPYDTVIAGFQSDVPVFNRNQGNIESSLAEVRVAESNLAATEALVRAEVAAAYENYQTRRRQVQEFTSRFRSQAAETARIASEAYRLGGADLLRLLDAQRLRIETEVLYYQTLTEYRQSVVALQASMGIVQ